VASNQLELEHVSFSKTEHELSGAMIFGPLMSIVTDDGKDHFIWNVRLQKQIPKEFQFDESVDLSKLDGYASFRQDPVFVKNNKLNIKRLDLEGITGCGSMRYLADERSRNVLVIDLQKKTLKTLPVDFTELKGVYDGGENAGFEGVAIDCQKNLLYIAKERQPRYLITVDLKSHKILTYADVKDPDYKSNLPTFGLDFGDIYFAEGFLYGLSRNERAVIKIDPKDFAVLSKKTYSHVEDGMYDTGEPYGIAEILMIEKSQIIVGADNNVKPLSKKSKDKYKIKNNAGSLWYFKRPKEF
jgi:hypothetical protein